MKLRGTFRPRSYSTSPNCRSNTLSCRTSKMAPRRSNVREPAPSAAATTQTSSTSAGSTPASAGSSKSSLKKDNQSPQEIALAIWQNYLDTTPQRIKLIDVFMGFLVVVGGLQFLYVIIVGNYPFNAFLAGFSATVGQFVLTASLRLQTTEANKADFQSLSPERAFADFVFGSLILHFFCVNFIN